MCRVETISSANFELNITDSCDFIYYLNSRGWTWSGRKEDRMFLLFLARIAVSEVVDDFLSQFSKLSSENREFLDSYVKTASHDRDEKEALAHFLIGDNACVVGGDCSYEWKVDNWFAELSYYPERVAKEVLGERATIITSALKDCPADYREEIKKAFENFISDIVPLPDDVILEVANIPETFEGFDFSGVEAFIKSVQSVDVSDIVERAFDSLLGENVKEKLADLVWEINTILEDCEEASK